ncbi:LacI family DNA-binding transcriptional regulator [Glycomyces sp. TRM65418]|uniref:LacI family DNA-binding transcriptional regulator n=1 Tax=Glycomyces sp. TRM65418 TaxID=2867006 RepID=UPI001CE6742F|nr:LacI family DNA-binding transcriptional regulator [Glycomyces sp. TRM65418]MCC3761753.1 LacI family DNA-binding transcriptional regulator [Glycomyces sp. TRM65418]QZD55838.1 LacI family DNA-binding transcriptional regulator [Glycomyces sp. TRM65418]
MGRQPRAERVTLADVALRAGVSSATVSKVLNGRTDVSARTREHVLGVIAETGYRSTTPRHDRPRRQALVVVVDFMASPYAGTVLQEILAAATEKATDLLLRLPPDASIGASTKPAHTWITQQQVAGAVGLIELAVAVPDTVLTAANECELPIVTIDPIGTAGSRAVTIGSTNWAGGRSATDHLIRFGHRRIAWIGGPVNSAPSAERFHGYRAALEAADLAAERDLIRHDAFLVEAGFRHGHDMLSLPTPPTAVVAGNDEIAIGVLAAAKELGVDVPRQCSVTGFDDTPQTEWTTPALTSVRQPLAGMGRMAVETVLGMANGAQPASRHLQLATALTVRDSTGPAPMD